MANIYSVFPASKHKLIAGATDGINLIATDTIKIALLYGYTFNPAHDFWDDVSSYEVSLGGTYSAGGTTLSTGKALSYVSADEQGKFDADDLTIGSGMTGTFQQIVIYKSTGTAGTSPLIACLELDSEIVLADQDFTLSFPAEGILRFL